jgi:uncharacterized membrane protein SpoIIM required for sporulation
MMFDLKKEVKTAFIENKTAIIASALILFASFILGYVFEPYLHAYLNPVVEDLTRKVKTGVIKLTFADIFINNIIVDFRMFIYGIFFCSSALVLAFNGFFVGYYLASSNNLLSSLVFIVPHGIFEFSSCIVACAAGFVLFDFVCKVVGSFLKQKEMKLFKRFLYAYDENFDKLLQAFILLAVASVLMAIAGIFEVYITLPLGKFLLSVLS